MVFPELNGERAIDSVIWKCWYGEYRTIAELAKEMERLLLTGDGCSNKDVQGVIGGGPGDVDDGHDFSSQEETVRRLCEGRDSKHAF
ncbi:hypothetical protein BDV29DRAFT_177222 [Aspergillus leporis]|uniref:Uncharacterized protein n=1 Tax=Aspergillus leporis TaxID=41062 RepID=A0A5N5WZG9_9EURO|nr:hypothetical protein BDV29DRAFT_177222 [Aspergillus leporis]